MYLTRSSSSLARTIACSIASELASVSSISVGHNMHRHRSFSLFYAITDLVGIMAPHATAVTAGF